MSPLMIVKLDIPGQPRKQGRYIGILLQIDVFILEAMPDARFPISGATACRAAMK